MVGGNRAAELFWLQWWVGRRVVLVAELHPPSEQLFQHGRLAVRKIDVLCFVRLYVVEAGLGGARGLVDYRAVSLQNVQWSLRTVYRGPHHSRTTRTGVRRKVSCAHRSSTVMNTAVQ